MEDHSGAGQGAVLLDIGGDIGALVVVMPAELEGVEVEARRIDAPEPDRGHDHLQHVAVVARPVPEGGRVHSLVFAALRAGTYELHLRPSGPVRLTVQVCGGTVADAVWT